MRSRAWLFSGMLEAEISFKGAAQQNMLSSAEHWNAKAGCFPAGSRAKAAPKRPVLPRHAELCRAAPQIRQIVLNLPTIKRESP